jgi:hypothetical protein
MVRDAAAYDPAMGLFRNAIGLFRGRAGKDREKAAAELLNEQAIREVIRRSECPVRRGADDRANGQTAAPHGG